MLIDFFLLLRARGVPASTTEFLNLMRALSLGLAQVNLSRFYALSRSLLVKNEAHFDLFDRVFAEYFKGVEFVDILPDALLDWLANAIEPQRLSPEQLAALDHVPVRQ